MKGGVFTQDVIDTWISYKRSREAEQVALRSHPHEFYPYYDLLDVLPVGSTRLRLPGCKLAAHPISGEPACLDACQFYLASGDWAEGVELPPGREARARAA